MNEAVRQEVRRQSGFRCEYCHAQERHLPFSAFHLDHVVARQHAGTGSRLTAADLSRLLGADPSLGL